VGQCFGSTSVPPDGSTTVAGRTDADKGQTGSRVKEWLHSTGREMGWGRQAAAGEKMNVPTLVVRRSLVGMTEPAEGAVR
jgi:hypothetical protein